MENERTEFTVEYQDNNDVMYYRNVEATNIAEAKLIIHRDQPDATIRAVTPVSNTENDDIQD